ncbi:MAG: hypothetical protein RMJ67_01165 [Elusimicrobiota bacterium]|nr:hypothetical protein [Endomicrobiia bacterium]MDW8165113.1 hypothetical protein [Elusimicrobiota bacterium]
MSFFRRAGNIVSGAVKEGAKLLGKGAKKGAEFVKQHDIKFEKKDGAYQLQVERKQPTTTTTPTQPEQPQQPQPTRPEQPQGPNLFVIFLIILVVLGIFVFFTFLGKRKP